MAVSELQICFQQHVVATSTLDLVGRTGSGLVAFPPAHLQHQLETKSGHL